MRIQVQEAEHWYDEYLDSDHWAGARTQALQRARHRCQVCNSDQSLHVHHRNYSRLGEERSDDLTVLCADCHSLFHTHRRIEVTGKVTKQYSGVVVSWCIAFSGDPNAPNPDDLHIDIYDAMNERTWRFTCNYCNQNGTPGGGHYRALVEAMLGRKLRKRERISRDRLRWMLDDRRVQFDVDTYPDHPHIEPRACNLEPVEHRPA